MWKQHWNQDTGWGICPNCVNWLTTERGVDDDTLRNLYGAAGVNYAPTETKR